MQSMPPQLRAQQRAPKDTVQLQSNRIQLTSAVAYDPKIQRKGSFPLLVFGMFFLMYVLAIFGIFLGKNKTFSSWGLGYPIWCILLGTLARYLVVKIGAQGEDACNFVVRLLYLKAGLCLYIIKLSYFEFLRESAGFRCIAPISLATPPIVILSMLLIGSRVLRGRIRMFSLCVCLAVGTSVCGVSAAIAAGVAVAATEMEMVRHCGGLLQFVGATHIFCLTASIVAVMCGPAD
jgi:uncharacterized membrane protein YadS